MSLQNIALMLSLIQPCSTSFDKAVEIEHRELNAQTRQMNRSYQQRVARPMPYFKKQTHRRVGVSRQNNYYG
jgi:hypothetical protein